MATKIRKRGKSKRPPGTRYRPSDMHAWAKYWDCSPQEVRDAAKVSGPMLVDMQDWIRLNVAR
jgi:hypothetical protein